MNNKILALIILPTAALVLLSIAYHYFFLTAPAEPVQDTSLRPGVPLRQRTEPIREFIQGSPTTIPANDYIEEEFDTP